MVATTAIEQLDFGQDESGAFSEEGIATASPPIDPFHYLVLH